jgi:hypothetical protein
MDKPYIVFTGTASVGKTTLIKPLIPLLEKMYGEPIVHIAEVARSLEKRGYRINKEATPSTQRLIEDEYLRMETLYKDNVKIADRSIIDRYSYSLLNKGPAESHEAHEELIAWYHKNIERHCSKYSAIFHIPLTDDVKLELDGVRSPDEEYRQKIATIQEELIQNYGIKVHRITGTVNERLSKIEAVLRRESYPTSISIKD